MFKRKTLCLTVSFLLLTKMSSLIANQNFSMQEPSHLVIQNRILAKVNGKTLSVLDVTKKMEVYFNKYYPQYADAPQAKYQYFSSQWKETLLQMIDHELILADAEKMELKVTDAEVRESLLEKFGPNVMASLDKLGLSYEEAKTMVHAEIVVQRMTWFKIHAKALTAVNIPDVRSAYTSYCEKNPPKEEWEYQVVSIKAKTEEIASAIAEKTFTLCHQAPSRLSEVVEEIKTANPELENEKSSPFTITLSDPIKADVKNISAAYKDILLSLTNDAVSKPVKQVSKTGQGEVYRIFRLINHTKTPTLSFKAMQDKLHDALVQAAVEKQSHEYISKLRSRYGFDAKNLEENIPSGFQPFSLQ